MLQEVLAWLEPRPNRRSLWSRTTRKTRALQTEHAESQPPLPHQIVHGSVLRLRDLERRYPLLAPQNVALEDHHAVVEVILHRLLADEHLLGHFLVLVALRHKLDDLAFARAQRGPLAGLARARAAAEFARRHKLPRDRGRRVRVEPDLAAVHLADA